MKYMLFATLLTIAFSMVARAEDNPLLKPFKTPFGVPPFEKIKNEHFKPAIEEGMKRHNEEIDAIANNKAKPNFKNTIEALDRAGALLTDVTTIFFNLDQANTNDEMQKIAEEISPALSAHGDNILLNKKLFQRIKTVYDNRSKEKLNTEQKALLEETYRSFAKNGAALKDSDQEKLKKINEKLSVLSLKFGQNVLAETNSFKLVIDNKAELAGLPQSIIDGAAKDGKWVFSLQNPSLIPFLQYSSNRALREKIWRAYMNRANNNNENDNKEIIREMTNLRIERSKLLGFDTYADYVLSENMAKTPANVHKLLMELWTPAIKVAQKEASDMQEIINREGGKFKLEPWDWRYYSEKLRKEKYDLDEEQLRPYFELNNVREGVFTLANKLYGITFVPRKDIPKYHKDVQVYEVFDKNKKHLAILYMDFFPRDSKRSGAWMTNYREEYKIKGKMVTPVISLVCNFTPPIGNSPSLLTVDEVETLFHEFGHGLHGMFASGTYRSISGTNVARDFVELPSQIMENWASEPEMLALYAKHYKTGEVIPASLVEKMKNSSHYGQGFATVEYLAASLLDMSFHTLKTDLKGDISEFEKTEMKKIGLIDEIIPRYRSTYFQHIFSGGYSSGYYSYIWAGVLDADAFQAFKEHGLFDRKTADSFRSNVLSKGKTEDPMKLYVRFRGAEPSTEPLLRKRGLK